MSRRPTAKKKAKRKARATQHADTTVIDHVDDDDMLVGETVPEEPVRLTQPDKKVFSTEVPAHTAWERRCAYAPLWAQRLGMRSRVLMFIAACIATVLMAVLVLSGIYVVTALVGSLVVPALPDVVTSMTGVSVQEINTDQDAFLFMVVLPALFIVVALAVAVGLCVYKIIVSCARYTMSMLSCALVSKDVVSRMYHTRRAASDFQRSAFRGKGKHFVDVVDSWSAKK